MGVFGGGRHFRTALPRRRVPVVSGGVAAWLAWALAVGCGAPSSSGGAVRLTVTSDLALGGVSVLARVAGESGELREEDRWFGLIDAGGARIGDLPVVWERGRSGDRWVEFRVRGYDRTEALRAERWGWASVSAGRVVEVRVHLEAACAVDRVTCAAGEQCIEGACVPLDRPPGLGCGNGTVEAEAGEECDDGNRDDDDDCTSGCRAARCGDGLVWAGVEECDDGNADDSDACPTTCESAGCGDGFVRAGGEECDDGNRDDDDGCTSECRVARCGDGLVRAGVEECDGDAPRICTTACGSSGVAECVTCRWVCGAPVEACNGVDDDCDGRSDEDWACAAGASVACTTSCGTVGAGRCSDECEGPGVEACSPPAEACNGMDDDCDTACDEGFACCRGSSVPCTTSCGTLGAADCAADCTPRACVPPRESCNGADDDCDGVCDEPHACCAGGPVACVTACGSTGARTCTAECTIPAAAECVPPPESCNGLDDDCNGVTDDLSGAIVCGDGCCNGVESSCDCPADCGALVPSVPGPFAPRLGVPTGSFRKDAVAGTLRPTFRWSPSTGGCGAIRYELQVDDSCSHPGFASCGFPSPECAVTGIDGGWWRPLEALAVETTPPVGRRYFWRVRGWDAAGSCSGWSPVRYVDVGRSLEDLNGDGYSDLVVGMPQYDVGGTMLDAGAAYVYLGGAAGLPASPSTTLLDPALEMHAEFGEVTAFAGDVNADGYSDLLVGAPHHHGREYFQGQAYLFFGSASGPSASWVRTLVNPEPLLWGNFGEGLAGGADVDADGFGDIVVGAVQQPEAGSAYIYEGSATGPAAAPTRTIRCVGCVEWAKFGYAVWFPGDLNRDGFDDLAVGAPGLSCASGSSYRGHVYLYGGSSGGVGTAVRATLTSPGVESGCDWFGVALGSGDLDGDGDLELVIGASFQDGDVVDEGHVYVYDGGSDPWPAAPALDLDHPGDMTHGGFGRALDVTDLNGDGRDDLLVSATGWPLYSFSGMYAFFGTATGLPPIPDERFVPLRDPYGSPALAFTVGWLEAVEGYRFGAVAIGDPLYAWPDEPNGTVHIVPYVATGFWFSGMSHLRPPAGDESCMFGYSVAH